MFNKLPISLMVICFMIFSYSGLSNIFNSRKTMDKALHADDVVLRLGELGPKFEGRYPGLVRVDRQPAGIDFYEIEWFKKRGSSGEVSIDLATHSIHIHNVLSLQSAQEKGDIAEEGLYDWTVLAGITASEVVSHDEARNVTYDILKDLVSKGWRVIYYQDDPRLTGRDRLEYAINKTKMIGLDPNYRPSLEEWMKIESGTAWMLYANGTFLDVSFARQLVPAGKVEVGHDPSNFGVYLLTYSIKTETEYYRGYIDPNDRPRWKELLPIVVPKEVAKMKAIRVQREAELKARGLHIDETYQDPPLPKF